ncbi:16269_t:CDS:1, partial [Cetraspora pellucida]
TRKSGKLQTKLTQTNELSEILQSELTQIHELSETFQNESNESNDDESIISESSEIPNILTTVNEQDYSFLDALKDNLKQSNQWQANFPNEAYADFMKLIIDNNLTNTIGNAIIKFFNKHANRFDKPLPTSTKQGKNYVDNLEQPIHNFPNEIIFEFEETKYIMNYKNVFDGVKELLSREDIAKS